MKILVLLLALETGREKRSLVRARILDRSEKLG